MLLIDRGVTRIKQSSILQHNQDKGWKTSASRQVDARRHFGPESTMPWEVGWAGSLMRVPPDATAVCGKFKENQTNIGNRQNKILII